MTEQRSAPSGPRCPVCKAERAVAAYRPFCSRRCADIDLGRWFSGSYALAGSDADEGDGMPGPPPDEDRDT